MIVSLKRTRHPRRESLMLISLSLPLTIDAFYDIVLTLSQYYVDVIKKNSLIAFSGLFIFSPVITLPPVISQQMK